MNIRTFPNIRRRITAIGTADLFEPLTPWAQTLECLSWVQGVLALQGLSGTYRCRLGIQVAATSLDNVTAPIAFATPYDTYTTAVGYRWFRVDPNGASDGNIDTQAYFRIGLNSSYSGTSGAGDVELQGLCWR